jgi:predicted transcriptional regulator
MSFKPSFTNKGDEKKKARPDTKYESVTKFMTTNLITFMPDTDIISVIDTLLDNRITGAPVLNEKKELVGLIDDKDCLKVVVDRLYHNQPVGSRTAKDYMTNVMKTISVDADVVDAASIFLESTYKRLLVIDDKGRLAGQVSRADILRAFRSLEGSNWGEAYAT